MKRVLLAGVASFALAACSSSSGGGAQADASDDVQYYGPAPSDGSAEGEGGGDGGVEAAPVCKVPAGAVFMTQTEAGVIGCSAVTSNTLCDPQFRLICRAPDPLTGVPTPPTSLGCTLQPNNGDPTLGYWCCPCQ